MKFLDKLFTDFLGWFKRKTKQVETVEPKQVESPEKKKPVADKRQRMFEEAFKLAIRYSEQGITEKNSANLIRGWWARIGKKGYTEKTPWCTLGIHIPLMEVGLLEKKDLPKDIALARGYLRDVPKGFKIIPVEELERGDIAVKWRGSLQTGGGPRGWQGHIGWFDRYSSDGKTYYSIGANQSDGFNKKKYSKFKLLGGIRVVGDVTDTIDDDGGVRMDMDTAFVPEKFRARAVDMAKKYLLSKEVSNHNDIKWAVRKAKQSEARYRDLSKQVGLPWEVIAAIHYLESSSRFTRHLHNGDPLTARTVQVPKGRPKKSPKNGKSYTFEESAHDVFVVQRKQPSEWTLPNTMYYLEAYNGMGYFKRGLHSSYLTAGTQFQQGGKFVKDGVFDPKARSKRAGAMILLKKLGYDPL